MPKKGKGMKLLKYYYIVTIFSHTYMLHDP